MLVFNSGEEENCYQRTCERMMGLGGGCGVATKLGLGVYLGFPHLGLSLHTLQSARTFCATALFVIFCSHTPSKTTNKCHIIINMSSLFRGLIERG